MKLLIVHLSDMHLKDVGNPCKSKIPHVAPALQNEEVNLDKIVILVSGDVAFSGKSSQYDIAFDILTDLAADLQERLRCPSIRIVLTPGNHDCDFSTQPSVRKAVVDKIRSGGQPDEEMLSFCCAPQTAFFDFQKNCPYATPDAMFSTLHWEYLESVEDCTVQFRCLNTAWISMLNETQGAIHFPDSLLDGTQWTHGAHYVVSVFHHPYNWMPSASYRKFRGKIEQCSDLILTGHEHEPDHYNKYSFTGEVNEYLEGSVLQEHGREDRAGFHAVFVDLANQRQKTVSYWWENELFVSETRKKHWYSYKRGARSGRKDFVLSPSFEKWLSDPGAAYNHPRKSVLLLSDIFVFPNLKAFTVNDGKELSYTSFIEGRDLLKLLGAKDRVFLFGRHQAGKTTLAKVLFRDFYNKGLTPVYLDGGEIRQAHLNVDKLQDLVEKSFHSQYENPLLPAFQQLDRDKVILIIDDFDHARLNATGRVRFLLVLRQRYERALVLGDDLLKFEELVCNDEAGELFAEFHQYELVQFGYLLRSKLITQWYSIGSEYDADPENLGKRIHQAEKLVTTMLGRSYLPSFPVFILSLIQAEETLTHASSGVGTYGGLYEHLITRSLISKSARFGLEMKLTYLSELAYWMHEEGCRRISDDQWNVFHIMYCAEFNIQPSLEELKREFSESALIEFRDQLFGFRHSASFYYFTARRLRDKLSDDRTRNIVRTLLKNLHKEECASIWLFLTHLSKDKFLVDELLHHARSIFADFNAARFEDDIQFLAAFGNTVEKIAIDDKEFEQLKEERLRNLDANATIGEEPEQPDSKDIDLESETDDLVIWMSKFNLALRTLEILGQLVKNFPGSLKGSEKHELVKEAYSLGLRCTSMMLESLQSDPENWPLAELSG